VIYLVTSDYINKVIHGDCLEKLKELDDNSIDAIVTDPPYGLGFMGKEWDTYDKSQFGVKGNEGENDLKVKKNFEVLPRYRSDNSFYEFSYAWAKECLRVLKPGGHLLSFGGTRTYHRMACAIEDAGFEIRDQIQWIYGSGFPKSLSIGKAIDKLQGNEREEYNPGGRYNYSFQEGNSQFVSETATKSGKRINILPTKGTSEWEGWGTALKPACEKIVMAQKPFNINQKCICMARKPLSEKSVAENVLKWGTGGINIDECRIGTGKNRIQGGMGGFKKNYVGTSNYNKVERAIGGRFPANVILDGSDEVVSLFPNNIEGKDNYTHSAATIFRSKTKEYNYNKECKSNWGSAARFFYCAKASKSERNEGLDGFEEKTNSHPTVKPVKLMEYLIKLVTPKNGIVLDPFTGSGSTGIAALKNNYRFIGIEKEEEYVKIAEARLGEYNKQNRL